MRLPTLWSSSDPFRAMQREMDDMMRSFGRLPASSGMEMRVPAMNVSESDGSIEISAELPGVDDKDITVSVDGNRLYISGEKKRERDDTDKDWHIVERSFGSFQRSLSLPFEPADDAVEASVDKGVLHVTVRKPRQMPKGTRTIDVRAGAPAAEPSAGSNENAGGQAAKAG
ncbi:Hsp20/alpha crystallin family protein [Alsobacter sp. SYSU M60028]|uniref:Hsp20/alpha crystallin family protein n=1 Tax=Alsobacter ponti TaxID=2962936 RepID=A0ABT1LDZ0_9HYPH|nr:Hsp20/alpha crystallin family protein [Alsobacter ponti]MCP8939326.1 Hsp20/alpha crystallin family protein [Alsobacter ponti]